MIDKNHTNKLNLENPQIKYRSLFDNLRPLSEVEVVFGKDETQARGRVVRSGNRFRLSRRSKAAINLGITCQKAWLQKFRKLKKPAY